MNCIHRKSFIFDNPDRVTVSAKAKLNNALLNAASGSILIEDYVFCGHNVLIVTGTHDYSEINEIRQQSIPVIGRDIVIKSGVWIGSNVVILGPCTIGTNAVIAANSLVNSDVPANEIHGGVPARFIKRINLT